MTTSGLDPREVELIRAYVEGGKSKPTAEERQAFNEGVVCSSLVLGAYIDSTETPPEATKVLEADYRAILGIKQRRLAA